MSVGGTAEDASALADPAHPVRLDRGVQAWSSWRAKSAGPVDLSGADLGQARLAGVDLSGVSLAGAYLVGADPSGADLRDVDIGAGIPLGADLADADLRGANPAFTSLAYAEVDGALLDRAALNAARGSRDEVEFVCH